MGLHQLFGESPSRRIPTASDANAPSLPQCLRELAYSQERWPARARSLLASFWSTESTTSGLPRRNALLLSKP